MRPPTWFPLALLGLASGCADDSKGGPVLDDTAQSEVFGDCDPAVFVPEGLIQADDPVPAGVHSETYGAAPDPFHVHLGWPSRDPSTSVSMLWRTDVDTLASVVEIGPADSFPEGASQVEGYSFLFGGGEIGTGNYRMHETRLCGLVEPGTSYTYRVGGEGGWSKEFSFTTPGAPGSMDTFRIAFSGDSRGTYSTWQSVLSAMEAEEPDLYVFSGDMVELGALQSEWDAWFDASGDVLATKPFMGAHGNHEFLAQNYFAQFGYPGNEEWFALDFGDLQLLTLNDTVRDAEHIAMQATWARDELSASTATWKLANHHQPAYTTSNHGSREDLRELWSPVWESEGVDLVANGHNHVYERTVPIADDAEQALGEGVVYLISGGAGAPLYGLDEEETWFRAAGQSTEHFVIGDFSPTGASFVVKELETGDVIDTFELPKG